jgi:hypothetical protein
MPARVALLLAVCCLATPASAVAQFEPLPPPQPPPQTQPQQPITPRFADEDEGLSDAATAAIVLGGMALLLGIGWLIVRDARKRAPVEERAPGTSQPKGTVSPQRHQRARAKAKAARQQRKRNRAKR